MFTLQVTTFENQFDSLGAQLRFGVSQSLSVRRPINKIKATRFFRLENLVRILAFRVHQPDFPSSSIHRAGIGSERDPGAAG